MRRAKLYYLRGRTGKSARIAEKQRAIVPGASDAVPVTEASEADKA